MKGESNPTLLFLCSSRVGM